MYGAYSGSEYYAVSFRFLIKIAFELKFKGLFKGPSQVGVTQEMRRRVLVKLLTKTTIQPLPTPLSI